jgi:DNA-damage-inducible protein J
MAITNINIRTDSEIKAKAQSIFSTLGLDMTTAINLFLRQAVRENDIPFVLSTNAPPSKRSKKPVYGGGSMKGKVWMAEDFDAPLEDFGEYME